MTDAPISEDRDRPAYTVAGIMSTLAIAVGLIAIVYKPVRLSPVALLIALIAAGIGGRHARLAGVAVAVVSVGWVLGMIYCVLEDEPLW